MVKILMFVLALWSWGCVPPSVVIQPENIRRDYYQVNKSDGVSSSEAVAIARYSVLTSDYPDLEPIRKKLDLYKVWNLEEDEFGVGEDRPGYRMGFRFKNKSDNPPGKIIVWRVYVDAATGEVVNAFLRTLAE